MQSEREPVAGGDAPPANATRAGRRLRWRSPLLLIFLAWSLYDFVLIWQSALWWIAVDRRPVFLAGPVIYAFVLVWAWAAMTPAVMWLTRRFPVNAPRPWRSWCAHAAAAIAVTIITALVETAISTALPGGSSPRFILTYVDRFDVSFFFYVGTVAVTHALDHARLARERQLRALQLQTELSRAQLRGLRMQIQPHFLFNALNTISSLLQQDPEAADRMLSRLGDLLRLTLEERDSPESTLDRELELVRRYTEIEQIRFAEWLTVDIAAEPDVLDAKVPGMLLQPLIENAIRHGIAPLDRPGSIQVRATRVDGDLVLTVQDDGVGLPPGRGLRRGIGLTATAERLEHLYGTAQQVSIANVTPAGTRVTLRIPFVAASQPVTADV